jgi:hypothetical protein
LVTDAPAGDDLDADADLAESLHRVLATLTRVRHDRVPLPAERLRERLELVQWLRHELSAVESLLLGEYRQVQQAPAPNGQTAGADGGSPAR